MVKLKMHLFDYECGNCGFTFKVPKVVVGDWFVMCSEGVGTLRAISIRDNAFLDEVWAMVDSSPLLSRVSERRPGEAGWEATSAVVDPDVDGTRFILGSCERCPRCAMIKIARWQATDPPEFVERDIPEITHDEWDHLLENEKMNRIFQAVDDHLSR